MHQHLLRTAAITLATLALSGCYVLQAAGGQAQVIHRSKPIPQVLADPTTPPKTKERLQLVEAARAFAIEELALPDGRSYRKYADMGRPYVVHNVVATPEFSVEPHRWCFPITGCIAYRGYFDEQRARAYGLKLSMRGDDVSVGGVPTYSTLGHLPDPVFGSMLGWRDTRLVGTIFHELAHERLYFADDSEVNEAFASVVEDEGIRRWLQRQGRTGEIVVHEASMARHKEFAALLRVARSRLADLYASGLPPATMRIEKQREFGQLEFRYEQLRGHWGGYAGYDSWFARSLNNAHLAAVATYEACVPGLRRTLQAAGSLPAFYEQVESTRGLSVKERHAELCRAVPSTDNGPPVVRQ
jgi:predicted aminopeptidase